jgi:DNA-binding response OmpR family regulator
VAVSRRSIRVLIVEDEPATALLLESMLEELGFEDVHIAYDAGAARDVMGEISPNLAILDMNMGQDTILRLAERLRARNVPVCFSSCQPANETLPGWPDRPLVPKPLDKRMLDAALRNLGFEAN